MAVVVRAEPMHAAAVQSITECWGFQMHVYI